MKIYYHNYTNIISVAQVISWTCWYVRKMTVGEDAQDWSVDFANIQSFNNCSFQNVDRQKHC